MSDELAAHAAGIGALAEPARLALYRYVAEQPDAVGREEAAAALGIAAHSAKFHLDRLVQEGLLDVEFRRLTGRSGPGAGRPSKLYRRSSREVSVSLPQRRYDLPADILASAVEAAADGAALDEAVRRIARAHGQRMAARVEPGAGPELERTSAVLREHGYEPRISEREITLANCPFDALAKEHTALVCGMNLALVEGVLDGLGCTEVEARLDPQPGLCCVQARVRA